MPPRISVVVPIYNVERYLAECLESVAGQTFGDLEVVMVDDGSTDASAAIAEGFVARDPRFRLLRQANGGLSKARNTGLDAATGTFLAFLDSDDVLPPDAYELLHTTLEKTGSDFATGNIHRLSSQGTKQSPFAAKAFRETRLRTHVTRFRPLVADRTAWNKLWRRSFWDEHALRFPEGVVHEDIPVVLPAHFMARSVDVLADPVYLYRIRESGALSITQRRLEPKVLRDRVAAVRHVSDFLAQRGLRQPKRWYDESVVAFDLRYHLDVLERADDDYRALFLELVNGFLDGADKGVFDALPAIQRLKWHLVRRRLMPQLLEVLRFQREDLNETAPVRARGRWYGDYPFRTDRALRIPPSVYRLRQELGLQADVESVGLDRGRLHVTGHAYIDPVGAPEPGAQRVTISVVRPGRLRPIRARATPFRARAAARRRPDVAADVRRPVTDATWSGFEAALDLRQLHPGGRWLEGTWELHVTVRVGATTRRRKRFPLAGVNPATAVETRLPGDAVLRAGPAGRGGIAVHVQHAWARLRGGAISGDALLLSGEAHVGAPSGAVLELGRRDEPAVGRYPVEPAGASSPRSFTARVPLEDLRGAGRPADPGEEHDARGPLELHVVAGGRRIRVGLDGDELEAWSAGDTELELLRTRHGDAALAVGRSRPVVTDAAWTGDAALELSGVALAGAVPTEVVLRRTDGLDEHPFPVAEAGDGRFRATLTPASNVTLAGPQPLGEGTWMMLARRRGADGGRPEPVPIAVAPALAARLPLATVAGGKPFALGRTMGGAAKLVVRRDLADDEQGRFHALRLRRTAYAAGRAAPLRDAVIFSSFHGRQYSDSPRAIHEELVRRAAPLEHLWIVRDASYQVPDTATALREGSREYYEALARARYVVFNDHFPEWFERRPDQLCVQTWHGTPLKRLGFDASEMQGTIRRFEHGWEQQASNWQYVVSPNSFTTPILQRASARRGEMLETGYPRDDVLAAPGLDERGRRVRERLGVPADARVVLYAPTYRDQVRDRRGRYRLDWRLDVPRLRDALGPDTVLLVRKHHYLVDAVPVTPDGLVRDVSTYPDGTELMAAADVLVTDYSSMMFDFANTRRPILFFTYDLDAYRDEIRGFYFDFVEAAPGPLLRTSTELADALRDLDGIPAGYEQRYADFTARFCEFDDGHASARVVDRVFG